MFSSMQGQGFISLDFIKEIFDSANLENFLEILSDEILNIASPDILIFSLMNEKEKLESFYSFFPEHLKPLKNIRFHSEFAPKQPLYSKILESLNKKQVFRINRTNLSGKDYVFQEKFKFWNVEEIVFIPLVLKNKESFGILGLYYIQTPDDIKEKIEKTRIYLNYFSGFIFKHLKIKLTDRDKKNILLSKEKYRRFLNFISVINLLGETNKVCHFILNEILDVFSFDLAYILIENNNKFSAFYSASKKPEFENVYKNLIHFFNQPKNQPAIDPLTGPDMILGLAFTSNNIIYLKDVEPIINLPMREKDKKALEIINRRIRTVVHVPINCQGKPIGVLELYSFDNNIIALDEENLDLLFNLCSFMPTVLKNAELHSRLEKQNRELEQTNSLIHAKTRKIQADLKLASQIQINMVPQRNPVLKNADFAYFYKPSKALGGDFFDFIHMEGKKKLGIFISDVSGNGVAAALITGMIKTLIENAGKNKRFPEKMLQYLNQKIYGHTNEKYLTSFYGIYDTQTKILSYSRAGQPYPLLIRNQKIMPIKSLGGLIGFWKKMDFEKKEIQLQTGDKLLFFTDGLFDARNEKRDGLKEGLYRIFLEHADRPIQDFIDCVYYELFKIHEDYVFIDDICLVGMEVKD